MYIIIKDKAGNKTHADYCKWMSKQKEGGGGGWAQKFILATVVPHFLDLMATFTDKTKKAMY